MTIHVEETEDTSRQLAAGYEANQNSIDLEFFYWDDEHADLDPVAVGAAVNAVVLAAPYGDPLYNLRLQTINLRPLAKFAGTAMVHYGVFEPPKITEGPDYKIRVGFSIDQASEHITHSLATVKHPNPVMGPYWVPPDFHNGIKVVNQGGRNVPQGTNRNVAQLAWRIVAYINPDVWTNAEWDLITELCNTWNLAPFKGWAAGRLLFLKPECAEYEVGTGQIIPVTFHFLVRRQEFVDKGDGFTFTKEPWSFLWDWTQATAVAGTDAQGLQIACCYEEQTHAGSDFSLLGLGT